MPNTKITTIVGGITTAACVWYAVNWMPVDHYLPSENYAEATGCCLPEGDFQNSYYSIITEKEVIRDQIESIHYLVSTLIENTQDLDPQISKLIDEHFWELG